MHAHNVEIPGQTSFLKKMKDISGKEEEVVQCNVVTKAAYEEYGGLLLQQI